MNGKHKRILLWSGAIWLLVLAILGTWMVNENMNKPNRAIAPYAGHGGTFKNTLASIDTPDPSIAYKDGFYYMTFTHNGTDVMIMKSRTLDFKDAEKKVVWYPPVDTAYSSGLWAPEIQHIRGKWYVYFAADDGENENHRMYALEADTEDPMGSYTFKGQITDESNRWAIDGLVLEHEEKLYFVWSGWEGDVNIAQNTYIAPMSDPLTISGPRVLLSAPELEWERAGGPPYINEGQSLLKKDGRVFLVYSGAGSWTPHYSLGMLALKPGGDPLNPADWTKSEQPLMAMDDEAGVYGPGHNSFAASPDGSEDWIVYHATSGIMDGWNNRKARAQRVAWGEDGLPMFGKPLSLDTAIPVPSGSGVFLAEHATPVEGGLRFEGMPLGVGAAKEAPLLLHYRNDSGQEASARIESEGGQPADVALPPLDEGETGYAYAVIGFPEGSRSVTIGGLDGGATVTAIEIPRYEAEYAQGTGGMLAEENPFSSGSGVMRSSGEEGEAISFASVIVPESAEYTIRLAVSNPSGEEMKLTVRAGGKKTTVAVPSTERSAFPVLEIKMPLREGVNSITLEPTAAAISVDYMDIVR
ncbi:family 43 glycosylhydrolase [Paenibacillus sp. LHD-117]|uniref:family 43 glycosylhydrolase n=1 Tax=Paenibacillus sp. LHD-117 TaxID=3071412 RepID=UPI0027DEF235|nr:family 43 glycosylhydrolase [Paenibacillus sp. LHD-117]MDQ6419379.1 family 43 glycosylhydrolase [Paenibacillus sp. LHD-117]